MRIKILIVALLLLAVPNMASAYYVWHPCCYPCGCCCGNRLPGWWGSADYLLIWRKGRFIPPLVTTNSTVLPVPVQPVLGFPGTVVLFGDERVGKNPESGIRADLGIWLPCCCCNGKYHCLGIGGGAYGIDESKCKYRTNGDEFGLPILGRPFFNTVTQVQEAYLISFPNALFPNVGGIDIDTTNRVWGANLYARHRLIDACWLSLDVLGGLQYHKINDNVGITSRTTRIGLAPIVVIREKINDQFKCTNEFCGGLVGAIGELRYKCWGLVVNGKVGIGNMDRNVRLKAETTRTLINAAGEEIVVVIPEGLLADPGFFCSEKFEVIPEVSASLQYRVCDHIWITAGYTFTYFPSVSLAGDQIDLNIPSVFEQKETSFWIQGVTAGFYIYY